jgi:membrane-associated phospholipid phosphatase
MFSRTGFKLTAMAVALAHAPAEAQSISTMLGNDVRNSVGDAWDVWTSPLRGQPRDWLTAAGIIAVSAAVSPIDDNVDRWAVARDNDGAFEALKPFRQGGVAFSGTTIAPVALGVLVVSLATKSEPMQEALFGCATAYGASSAVRTFVIYPLVARTRPDPRSPEGPPPPATAGDQYHFSFPGTTDWGGHSLPGGHIANVVACAEFLTSRFQMGFVEPALWALSGGIALARILDRGHWTSDQVIGAAFGYAVGREIALRSKRRASHKAGQRATAGPDAALFIAPSSSGMKFGWNRAF